MSLNPHSAKHEKRKSSGKRISGTSPKEPSTSLNGDGKGCKKQVKISPGSPTLYEDETKKGLQVYNSLSRTVVCNPLNRHSYLHNIPINKHWQHNGTMSLIWYQYVSNLKLQRTQLILLRKLFYQKYYTTQFLYTLQQFLNLQQEVESNVTFYQSHSLDGETSKLPKLNILCKQIVSLLNDLASYSMQSLAKSLDRSINLAFVTRCQTLYNQLTFDLIHCVRLTRRIIMNEIKFCYLFSNFRSRIFSMVDKVVKFNDIVYHPLLAGKEQELVILLEDVIESNVRVASLYIARSYHHKILSAHFKSVPQIDIMMKLSDIIPSVKNCQVCSKLGQFLHKYCTNKCGAFLDAISTMIQGAGDNRVISTTDNCTSRYVEELLSTSLHQELHYLAESSVSYEPRISCGDKSSTVVHEQFCDQSRSKTRRKWDDNYTNVIYTCTQRGLPSTWTTVHDINNFYHTAFKLDTSYYSMITCDFAWELKLIHLSMLINQDREVVFGTVSREGYEDKMNDILTAHFNKLSYLVFTDSSVTKDQIKLYIKYVQHLNQLLRYLYREIKRLLSKFLSSDKHFDRMFGCVTLVYQFCAYLESLHKQLHIPGELKVPPHVSRQYSIAYGTTKEYIELLKDLPDWLIQGFIPRSEVLVRERLQNNLPSVSYWKKDVHETDPSSLAREVASLVTLIMEASLTLPEPYLTRVNTVVMSNVAQAFNKNIVANKKINFSYSGITKLESDADYLIGIPLGYPYISQTVVSSPDVLNLRNDLTALILKRRRGTGKPGCTCDKQGNWKRLSVPQLCTTCNNSPQLLKPATDQRKIFSDSEADSDNVSQSLRTRQKKLVKQKLQQTF